jgi:hypothetical protein
MAEMYQMTTKYAKWPLNIPNGRKIFEMATKYKKIVYTLRGPPKYTQMGI